MLEWLFELFLSYASSHPALGGLIVLMSLSRAIFKPMMTVIEAYIAETPGKKDDEWLGKLKDHPVYKSVVWFVDFLLSVKLPK